MEVRTLVLHVGIHKTASTYIQHRLKRNQPFLRQQGLLYPKRRRDHLQLVKALVANDPRPWRKLLRRAAHRNATPLVSAELLSVLLHRPAAQGSHLTLLGRLCIWLDAAGVRLHLVAFIRDQPSYLNSRYTQLIKRLYFALSFRRYVLQTLRCGGDSECDYERLFVEALDDPRVVTSFLPFRSGEADPCERLLASIGVADCAALTPLTRPSNVQPGWRAVWLAQRLARLLRHRYPEAWSNAACKAHIRDALERCSHHQGWQVEPFQGLTAALQSQIEEHYGPANERFAQRVWGCSWRSLFSSNVPQPSPHMPLDRDERRRLLALADPMLQDVVSSFTQSVPQRSPQSLTGSSAGIQGSAEVDPVDHSSSSLSA